MDLTWKNVFNSTVGNKWWGYMGSVCNYAKEGGYKYFSWNGWVYTIDGVRTTMSIYDLDNV